MVRLQLGGQALLLFKRSRDLHLHWKVLDIGNWTFSKPPYEPQSVIGHPVLALPPPSPGVRDSPGLSRAVGSTPPLLPPEPSGWALGAGACLMSWVVWAHPRERSPPSGVIKPGPGPPGQELGVGLRRFR